MSAQLSYGYNTPLGEAGGIVDIAPYAIDTFLNEENTGTMEFGIAVFAGTTAGVNIKKPTAASTVATFEGFTTNNRSTEYDLEGVAHVIKGAAMGVMRYGRIYAKVADNVTPANGGAVYVIKSGTQAGYVTTSDSGTLAIKARFLGGVKNGIAAIELFNQAQA